MRAAHRRDEDGFTLVELLVVVLIIGILSAVALPSFLGHTGKGAKATARANLSASVTRVEACGAADNDYSGCLTSANLTQGDYPVTGVVAAGNDGYTLTVARTGKLRSAVTLTNTAGVVGAISGGD